MTSAPQKPFESYKWRWLSVLPTEGLLDPPVFLGVLRVFANHENEPTASPRVANDLRIVKTETHTNVNLVRTPSRNLIRNSGQYWKGTGLLAQSDGAIRLTPFGRRVARGEISQAEFAGIIIQQTVLPNPWTYNREEIQRWTGADLKIRPFVVVLDVLSGLARARGLQDAYITPLELIRIVIPLAGAKAQTQHISDAIIEYRAGQLDLSGWPDCAPASNDRRLAREFLLFLANFGICRKESAVSNENEKYHLEELIETEALVEIPNSIFSSNEADATAAIETVLHSPLPSMIERERLLISVITRPDQRKFRKAVLKASRGQCIVTAERISNVLEAAHIVPVENGGADEASNGFCLRVDVHRLFDSGNLRIKPDGNIILTDLTRESINYAALPRSIAIPAFVNPANISWRDKYL